MRVFVTGASGFIGSATVQALLAAGHTVTGLARSDASAAAITAAGAEVHRGAIRDLDSLRAGAAASDGVIHLAFNHDFSTFADNCEDDRLAITAMADALDGSDRSLVIASGTLFVSPGSLANEDMAPAVTAAQVPRVASEDAVQAAAARGVRACAVRLPPTVHGDGDQGFIPQIINIARDKGVSAYVGEGAGRWPAVHRLDAAQAFRLALEKGAAGARYHAVGEEGVATRDIAAVIGKTLGLPLASKTPEEAGAHFGFLGLFFGFDAPASSALTQQRLGWSPAHKGLIADLEEGTYFAG